MPKRMRKESSVDCVKIEFNSSATSPLSTDTQSTCFGCGHSLNDSPFVLNVKSLPNHKHASHLYLHRNCLRCFDCKEILDENRKCYFNSGKLWCEHHYFQLKTCSGCKKTIAENEWVYKAGLKKYHLSCFNCNKCDKQLAIGEQFKIEFQDQKFQLICKMHFDLHKECTDGNESSSDESETSSHTKGCSKTKRVRTTFTEEQLQILQAHFEVDSNPDGQDLERIATRTGLSKRVTQVWYQNSRARTKKNMNKTRLTLTPLTGNLNSNSINGPNGLLLNCAPGTPNSSNSTNSGNVLHSKSHCLTGGTNSSINSSPNGTPALGQQSVNQLSHSTNTNFSNNQINSPYQDHHSELNSPLMMNAHFNDLQTINQLDRLNGSLNSLGSNSSSSLNSNSGSVNSSCVNNLITFHGTNSLTSNLTKKIASLANSASDLNGNLINGGLVNNLSNGLASGLISAGLSSINSNPNFAANRENINCNNVQYIEFHQMKDNLDVSNQNSLTNSNNATFALPHQWRLLDSNLCNTNALLTANETFDYGSPMNYISGN